jgi:hypothetical protein
MKIRAAAIILDQRSRQFRMNMKRGGAVLPKTNDMREGAHDRLKLIEAAAISLRNVQRAERGIERFQGAIKGECVLQAVDTRR